MPEVGFWYGLAGHVDSLSQVFDLANIVGSLSAYSPALGTVVGVSAGFDGRQCARFHGYLANI